MQERSEWLPNEQLGQKFPQNQSFLFGKTPGQQDEPCSEQPTHPHPTCFLKTHFVPMGLEAGGGSTKTQTWFLSKFSSSSCMALTQLESERACPISLGSKEATNVE